jgi:restriction endonuclease S subunit
VKSPADNKEQKQFLGYEWSNAKGNEGLKYLSSSHITPLFDPDNRYNDEKINYWIQQNFNGNSEDVELQNLSEYITYASLVDLLDFSRKDFNKAFSLTPKKTLKIETKWELVKLENICEIVRGASPRPIDKYITTDINGINWIKIGDVSEGSKYITQTAEKITLEGAEKSRKVNEGDFILSNSMSFRRPYIMKISGCIHDGWLLLSKFSEKLNKDYLYEILSYKDTQQQFSESAAGGVVQNLNTERVKATKIPLPPLEVQQQIVDECEAIDQSVIKAKEAIEQAKKEIEEKVNSILTLNQYPLKKLNDLMVIVRGASPRPIKDYLTNDKNGINWIKIGDVKPNEKYITQTEEKITQEGAEKTRLVQAGNFILSNSMSAGRPYIVYISGCIHDGWLLLSEFDNSLNKDYFYDILSYNNDVKKQMTDNALGGTVKNLNIDRVQSIKIPLPPLSIQEQLVAEVEKLEEVITNNQKIIDESYTLKQQVMKKYL